MPETLEKPKKRKLTVYPSETLAARRARGRSPMNLSASDETKAQLDTLKEVFDLDSRAEVVERLAADAVGRLEKKTKRP